MTPFLSARFTPTTRVSNIRELAMEIKSIGGVNYNLYPNTTYSTANYHLLQDLSSKMVITADKHDFKKLMDLSKVIGKEVGLYICIE